MKDFQTGMSAVRNLRPCGPFSAVIRDGKKTFWHTAGGGWNWINANEAMASPLATYKGEGL